MQKIALIAKYSWVGFSTSFINTALFWASKGYQVDVFCEKPDLDKYPLPSFNGKTITYFITNIQKTFLMDDLLFRKTYLKNEFYQYIIGFDNRGVIRAAIASIGTKSIVIYHSLEFFEKSRSVIKFYILKTLEMLSAHKATYIFTQDERRALFLSSTLKQRKEKFKIVFNSPKGKPDKTKSNYFRKLFNISDEKLIVLCIGSMTDEHYVIDLVNSIENWDEKFVLILHGWFPDEKVKLYVQDKMMEYHDKLFLSDKFFPENQKHLPYQACDIGFVGFKPFNFNFKYAAGSAGKLFDFLKHGVPLIAYTTPGMKNLIKGNRIGKCFNKPTKINRALLNISAEYSSLRINCFNSWLKYEFNNQYNTIFENITKK